jgi:hypothetical protein
MSGHVVTVKDMRGRVHSIPDIWIAGYCQGARIRKEPSSHTDAIAAWITNAWLAEQDEQERDDA